MVVQANNFITQAIYDPNMPMNEIKLVELLISNIKTNDREILSYLGLKNNGTNVKYVENLIHSLWKRELTFIGELSNVYTQWFYEYEQFHQGGVYIFHMNTKLAKFFLMLKEKGHYTQYFLEQIKPMKSKYSIKLFKLLQESTHSKYQKEIEYSAPKDIMMEQLGCPAAYLNRPGDFKRKILQPAIKDLSHQFKRLKINLETQKAGHSISGFRITAVPLI